MNIYEELQERGLLAQVTDEKEVLTYPKMGVIIAIE